MKIIIGLCVGAFITAALTPIATAEDSTVVVWPGDVNGWTYTNFEALGSQTFVNGPDSPPIGMGSAAFSHEGPAGFNGGTLHSTNLNGIYLRDITDLRYSTYQQGIAASLYQPPYVVLFLDLNDDGFVDDGVAFEPAWQSGNRLMLSGLQETLFTVANQNIEQNGIAPTAAVPANEWWEWDLLIGSWWGRGGALSTGTNKLGVFQCWADGCVTIEAIVEVYPNARIISQGGTTGTGGIRLQYGFGGNSHEYVGHVDKLVVGLATGDSTTYDFELGPENKDACKNGGWVGFFRNQGQCVSYFVSNKPR
jgi:hypothetical protein